jgi:hypothetical protein
MAANQEKSEASLEKFDFEGDTNDSDYFLVKRIKVYYCNEILQFTERELVIYQENVTLLSNTDISFEIAIRDRYSDGIHNEVQMEIRVEDLSTLIYDNTLDLEISVHAEISFFSRFHNATIKLTKISQCRFSGAFQGMPRRDHFGNLDGCKFQVVFKLPYDVTSGHNQMSNLFTDSELSDVKIICDDQTFQCHRLILAMKSDVFKAMLYTRVSIYSSYFFYSNNIRIFE